MKRLLIFIVAYKDEKEIVQIIDRIPEEVKTHPLLEVEVLIIEGKGSIHSNSLSNQFNRNYPSFNVKTLSNPVNVGYGERQKLGYHYALKNNFDIVLLLHGDGAYSPEHILQMIDPILNEQADVVIGSRMIDKRKAFKSSMPLYKFIGNILLTTAQNLLLGTKFSEIFSGYRACHSKALKFIPYAYNSDDFDFDSEVIIQMINTGQRIKEVAIPGYSGREISFAKSIQLALKIIKTTLLSILQSYGLFYERKFDYHTDVIYSEKFHFPSSHSFAALCISDGDRVLDIGCASGYFGKQLKNKISFIDGIDISIDKRARTHYRKLIQSNIDFLDWNKINFDSNYDVIILLDIIEHLSYPVQFVDDLRKHFSNSPKVVVTTANIVFLSQRLMTLFGQFNYGKRGLLDFTHRRLFSFRSIIKLFKQSGYQIEHVSGIPVPWPFVFGDNFLSKILMLLNILLIKISKSVFAYQVGIVARPLPTLNHLITISNLGKKYSRNTNH